MTPLQTRNIEYLDRLQGLFNLSLHHYLILRDLIINKRVSLEQDIGRWAITARYLGSNQGNRFRMLVASDRFSDSGILYDDGRMAWDFPERIPARVKEAARRTATALRAAGFL